MKFKSFNRVAYAFTILFGLVGTTFSFAAQGGHLMFNRVANVGEQVSLIIKVDGREVGRVIEGQSYDGYLPLGRHVISATITPNFFDQALWRKDINVQSGQTYSFTAAGERLGMRMKAAPKPSEAIPKDLRDLGLERALRNEGQNRRST